MITVLDLPAPPRARGEAHGESMRGRIHEAFARWHDNLAKVTGRDPHEWIADFLAASDHRPAIERWAPSFLEEIDGLAAASGVDPDEAYAFQLVDEQWAFERGCSTLGRPGLVAQNLDLPPWWDGLQTVLCLPDGQIIVTAAGFICMNGMSEHVAIGVNALPDVPSSTTGLPVAFAIRQALLEPSAELAVTFLESVSHAAGQSYIVADRTSAIGVEADAEGTTRFGKSSLSRCGSGESAAADVLLHTNHALVRTREDRPATLAAAALANTTSRLDALKAAPLHDVESVTNALSCSPILRQPTVELPGVTFATVVFDVDAQQALVRGGPGERDFATVRRTS
jgi:hypothetical protein